MNVRFHKTFDKQYKKLQSADKQRVSERMKLFAREPFHPILNNLPLKGKYTGFRSISMTGDLRAVYKLIAEGTAYFVDVDTHSNLYR